MAKTTKKKTKVRAYTRKTKRGRTIRVSEHERMFRAKHGKAAKKLKGKRKGQTKSFHGKTHYVKAGEIHAYDTERDRKIKSEHTRKKSDPPWRGDLKGRKV